jgi:RNA polymerase sigma-70 factor (sigma-E family)
LGASTRTEEFAEFASSHWMTLVRLGMLLGCSRPEAEDLAQSTLIKCHLAWTRVSAASDPTAYVSRILLNTQRASRRRRWWSELTTGRVIDTPVEDQSADVDIQLTIQAALRRLSLAHREVIVLRFYLNQSDHQIADTLGIAVGTVKSRLSRAMDRLTADSDILDLYDGKPQ